MRQLTTGLAGLLLMSTASFAGPSLITVVRDTVLPQKECQRNAKKALESAGFTKLEVTGQSVFGHFQAYAATIRCLEPNSIAFFIVAGPDNKRAETLLDSITGEFKSD